MLKLQYLICASRGMGQPVISHRHGARLATHNRLMCSAYICKSFAEFQELNQKLVNSRNRSLWSTIELVDTETGATFDPPADAYVVSQAFVDHFKQSLSGAGDGAQPTVPAEDIGAGVPAPESLSGGSVPSAEVPPSPPQPPADPPDSISPPPAPAELPPEVPAPPAPVPEAAPVIEPPAPADPLPDAPAPPAPKPPRKRK